jgi:hypothetical protein
MAYANADVNADVEKIKANFEHNEAEKKVAYVKADAEKARADVDNKTANAKADLEKAKADVGKKMDDPLK